LDSFINQKQEVMTPIYPKQDPEYRARVLKQFYKHVTDTKWPDEDEKGKKIGMAMCNSCGMISYPSKYQSKEEIIAHYRKEYRKPPSVMNMFTGQRKNHFHMAFLKEYFDWCSKLELINDDLIEEIQIPKFKEHRHDQAILTNLAVKNNIDLRTSPCQWGMKDKAFFNHHRTL
jgi:hypothetical protein